MIILLILVAAIGYINLQLYQRPLPYPKRASELAKQLRFLEIELKEQNLGPEMQQLFPEGLVFINVLYGLSWCELALATHSDSLHQKAHSEALFAYSNIDSPQARQQFPALLQPAHGIFYAGWKNYLLGKILALQPPASRDSALIAAFKAQCQAIEQAVNASQSPFLSSYNRQSWPADGFIAMTSLRIHDQLFTPKYEQTLANWLDRVALHLDPNTGMVPHKTDAKTGAVIEGARGGSSTLILRMLAEINPVIAADYYQKFKHHFVTTTLGLPAVREYPKGIVGYGDIDSGPVILGVGFAATIVSIGTVPIFGDRTLGDQLWTTVNAFGFAGEDADQQHYLWGGFPMADAFIAWSRATDLKIGTEQKPPVFGRVHFHLISMLVVLLFGCIVFYKSLWKMIRPSPNPVQ